MRNAVPAASDVSKARSAEASEARVLAELDALRTQVAMLQRLVLQREPQDGHPRFNQPSAAGPIVSIAPSHVSEAEPPLFASFFGSFALHRAGQRLTIGSSRTLCELGTYLIANAGKAVARDALMDLLWPEADPDKASHRLHVAISELRRVVDAPGSASVVKLQDDSYQIGACSVATDCELFEHYYQRARRAQTRGDLETSATAYSAALQLYTGEFLADHPYLDWAARKRAHYAERHLAALTALCDDAARRRDYAALEEYARDILHVDSLREQAHRYLMRAHYHLGRRASAIRQFRACAADLDRELGAPPSLLTQQLLEAVYRDTPLPGEIGPSD
jgi:DNA-binding SARP family transcriptional activator